MRNYSLTVSNIWIIRWHTRCYRDWSSDVCSSDLSDTPGDGWATDQRFGLPNDIAPGGSVTLTVSVTAPATAGSYVLRHCMVEIGRASCRERVKIKVGAGLIIETNSGSSAPRHAVP